MPGEPGAPPVFTSTSDLQRLRDIFYGDHPRRVEQRLSDLDAHLEALRRELLDLLADLRAQILKTQAEQPAGFDRQPARRSRSKRAARRAIDESGKWAADLARWKRLRGNPRLARHFIRFFRLALERLPEHAWQAAWFGIHSDRITLTVGNILLAGVSAPDQTVWLLVDQAWDADAGATRRYTPLGWRVRSWAQAAALNRSRRAWNAYATAVEKMWDSPASRVEIERNLIHKRKARALPGVLALERAPRSRT